MPDREKVINGLEHHLKELSVGKTCFECPYCGDNPCEIQLITDALVLLKAQEPQTVSSWVSVKERLPDEDGSTLICTKNGKVCTARFYKRQGGWNAYAGRNAEYWMPLPEPPKEDDA